MNLSETQLNIIEQQLGRKPRGIIRIAAQTSAGIPLVLQMRSWLAQAPFPTLYWLCSKDLHKAINQIETQGAVKALEIEIEQNANLRNALLADQQRYHDKRQDEMLEEDRQAIANNGFSELFESFGIGGIRSWDKVRCLHMHYAHHLAEADQGGTSIGRLLDQRYALNTLDVCL